MKQNDPMETEQRLIDRLTAREETALDELDAAYRPLLHRIAFDILQNEADTAECLNDCLLQVWESIPPNRPENLRAYLCRIVRNQSLKQLEKRQAQKRGGGQTDAILEELSECLPSDDTPEQHLEQTFLQDCLRQFLQTLPSREKELFIGRYFFSRSTRELCRKHHMKDAAVRKQLSRTREKLKEYLAKEGYIV